MSLILNIDTATENASVCISRDIEILAMEKNADQKNHAAFIQPAIKRLHLITSLPLQEIDAVAVTAGPGSYTGLRVGMATAKGLCYALKKPLILINTLQVMALASIKENEGQHMFDTFLFCPMIDARRMEVFTAIYNQNLQAIADPAAVILDENSFKQQIEQNRIFFTGSGSIKFKNILLHRNAVFSTAQHHAGHLAELACKAFEKDQFTNVAYSVPFYLKEFFNQAPKVL